MSFNTQHCTNFRTQKIDYDCMAQAIRSCKADIVGLNEMRGAGEDEREFAAQTEILAEKLGYYFYFAKAIDAFPDVASPYGNGLLSRFPILHAETIPVPDPVRDPDYEHADWYESRCLLKATLDVPGGLTVCVIHFGLVNAEQVNAVQTVLGAIEPRRCVLMGDFNVQPDNPLLQPIRERMYDTAALFDGECFSWPSDVPQRRIDYLFTSRDLTVSEADIPGIVASDHRPYVAKLVWRE